MCIRDSVKAGASEAEKDEAEVKDEAEAEGVWVAAPVEGDLKERDTGWLVQLVEGGSAGGGKDVPVVCGLWKQHRPIIMGSMGESLLSIEPAALAGALDRAGAAQADVLGVPAADGGGCAGDGCSGCKLQGLCSRRWLCRRWLQWRWLQGLCRCTWRCWQ